MNFGMPEESNKLLAVDLGMRAGLAWFDQAGRLIRARSTHFPDRAALKRALPGIWREVTGVSRVVLEGGGALAEIWLKSAAKQGLMVDQICAEQWRREVFTPSQNRNAHSAKNAACALAVEIARQDGCPPCQEFLDDVAEAIVFGRWYAWNSQSGLSLEPLPGEGRRGKSPVFSPKKANILGKS